MGCEALVPRLGFSAPLNAGFHRVEAIRAAISFAATMAANQIRENWI